MPKVTGVRFRTAGRNYYYDPEDMDLKAGDHVLVETTKGLEMGEITIPPIEVSEDKLKEPLRKIERKAEEADLEYNRENRDKEREAFFICRQKITEHNLDMKLVQAEYTFDRHKLIFYFTAEGRVDFRDLVKDLASVFRTRIELRQIGVRDETKILGGFGMCGRELCCKTYLSDFAPVSIKMAKEQNLSLNPTKISGLCGRLMCCLKNEEETYEYLNKQMPQKGDGATTEDGQTGVVYGTNILRQKVAVLFEENDTREIREFNASDLTYIPKKQFKEMSRQKAAEKTEEITASDEVEEIEAAGVFFSETEQSDELPDNISEKQPEIQAENDGKRSNGHSRNDHDKSSKDKNAKNQKGSGKNKDHKKYREYDAEESEYDGKIKNSGNKYSGSRDSGKHGKDYKKHSGSGKNNRSHDKKNNRSFGGYSGFDKSGRKDRRPAEKRQDDNTES